MKWVNPFFAKTDEEKIQCCLQYTTSAIMILFAAFILVWQIFSIVFLALGIEQGIWTKESKLAGVITLCIEVGIIGGYWLSYWFCIPMWNLVCRRSNEVSNVEMNEVSNDERV